MWNLRLFLRRTTILATLVFLIAAYNGIGYFHADEHYQIIEFAGIKLGTHTPDQLAWEYNAASRQAIQPAICFAVFSLLNTVGIVNPYTQALVLRLLTALLAVFVLNVFVRRTLHLVDQPLQKAFIVLSYFLWFIPAINTRFSSETWSGLFIVLMFAIILGKSFKQQKTLFLLGAAMGLAFLFRFQTAFLSIGIIAWMLTIEKVNLKRIVTVLVGAIGMLVLGIAVDSWFYGKFIFTPWVYFSKQILEGIASGFGESRWYFYIVELFQAPILPLGMLIFAALIVLLIRQPKSPLLWGIIPFIVFHSFVGHKETRFLFPLSNLMPLILVLAFQSIQIKPNSLFTKRHLKIFSWPIAGIFISINLIALAVILIKPAGTGKMEITAFIEKEFSNQPINMIHTAWASPYNPWESIPTKFYQKKYISETRITDLCSLSDSLFSPEKINLLVVRKAALNNEVCINHFKQFQFQKIKQSIPEWIIQYSRYYNGLDDNEILVLYQLKPAK